VAASLEQESQDAGVEVLGQKQIARAGKGAQGGSLVWEATGDNPALRLRRPFFVQITAGGLPASIVNIYNYYIM